MPVLTRLASTLLTLAILPAGTAGYQKDAGAPAVPGLSKAVKSALDEKYKKWTVATVDASAAACRQDGGAAPSSLQADFNSDGLPDLALAIKTADGVHLVVAFTRAIDVLIVDVEKLGDNAADGYLGVEKHGTEIKDELGMRDFLTSDTLAVFRCGQPRTLYLWQAGQFAKQLVK